MQISIDIPEPLDEALLDLAKSSGISIHALILRAIAETYPDQPKDQYVTGPLVYCSRKLGPRFPKDENPHELVIS